jgi:hypothetical protein
MAPELWRSGERRCILPQKLEDLEDPEYLEDIRTKINKMKYLKDLLDAGSITVNEYRSKTAQIFIRT